MFGRVETFEFFLTGDAETVCFFDDCEGGDHADCDPRDNGDETEELNAEDFEAGADVTAVNDCVDRTVNARRSSVGGEKTGCYRAPDAVRAVYADRADRIVDVELEVETFDDHNDEDTGDDTDYSGAESVDVVASRGDADKTGEAGVEAHRDIRLAVFDPCEEKCSDSGDRGGDSRGHENRSQLRAVCGSRAVESVPAEPEDERAESAERNVMTENRVNGDLSGFRILRVLSDTGTDHYSADQGGYAADRVNSRRTRERQTGGTALCLLRGMGIAFAITCIIFIGFGMILTYTAASEESLPLVSLICTALSVAAAGYDWAACKRKRGLLWGALAGLVYTALLYVITSLAADSFVLHASGLMTLAVALAAGVIGGILGVNRR